MQRTAAVKRLAFLFVLASCASAPAGWQITAHVGSLEIDGHPLQFRDGYWETSGMGGPPTSGWKISAPYVAHKQNLYFARDPDGKDPAVRVEKAKNATAEWGFELVSKLEPRRAGGGLRRGESGRLFRLRVPDGPFKNWYVGLAPRGEKDGAGLYPRRLVLVEKVEQAVVLRYVDTKNDTGHK